jgi:pre-mRNA branch site protein p14
VAYEDIFDAKNAVDHLSGFNISNRYLIVLYFNRDRMDKRRTQIQAKKEEVTRLKEQLDRQ